MEVGLLCDVQGTVVRPLQLGRRRGGCRGSRRGGSGNDGSGCCSCRPLVGVCRKLSGHVALVGRVGHHIRVGVTLVVGHAHKRGSLVGGRLWVEAGTVEDRLGTLRDIGRLGDKGRRVHVVCYGCHSSGAVIAG